MVSSQRMIIQVDSQGNASNNTPSVPNTPNGMPPLNKLTSTPTDAMPSSEGVHGKENDSSACGLGTPASEGPPSTPGTSMHTAEYEKSKTSIGKMVQEYWKQEERVASQSGKGRNIQTPLNEQNPNVPSSSSGSLGDAGSEKDSFFGGGAEEKANESPAKPRVPLARGAGDNYRKTKHENDQAATGSP